MQVHLGWIIHVGFYTGQIDPICIVRNPFPFKSGVDIKGIAGLYPDVQSK